MEGDRTSGTIRFPPNVPMGQCVTKQLQKCFRTTNPDDGRKEERTPKGGAMKIDNACFPVSITGIVLMEMVVENGAGGERQ